MIAVKATREGLVGSKTASGYIIDTVVPYVALPSTVALHQWVLVFNPANGKSCRALVLDVGPWNVADHGYVFQEATISRTGVVNMTGQRPLAESQHSLSGEGTNGAGIDLGEAVWAALGMIDNTTVYWEFL